MSAPVNQRTAAVIDPILSTHARGYRNLTFISHLLFPRASVPNRSMRTLRFGKESFRLLNSRRAPGAKKKRVQYGYAAESVNLVQDALEGLVPIEHQEEALSVPHVNLAQGAIDMVLDVIDLGHEVEASDLARDPANYDNDHKLALTGTDRWSDETSDPHKDVTEAKEIIRRYTGRYPNTLTLGPSAYNSLTRHSKIREQFKYTSSESITAEMLAKYFDLDRVIVGKAVFLPENATDDEMANDVWGDDAILAYVPMGEGNYQKPSFGYTYDLSGYPQVTRPYFEESTDSWIYPTKTERRIKLTSPDAGFLFQNAGASG